ncbi:MAG: D-aminoacyl-tRNA deacylase [Candidatus Helarchaeota archaeon]
MPIIIISNKDLAGKTIKQQLIATGKFVKTEREFEGNMIYEEITTKVPIITTNRRLIEATHLSEFFETDLFIFASKHKSESEKPSLLVHAPGNWTDDNSYGGNKRELAYTSAIIIKNVLKLLMQKRDEAHLNYDVTSEVTHHGPTNLSSPCVFIELGSNEIYWQELQGARIVAEVILKVISKSYSEENLKYAIGFGGPHYATNFNKIQLSTDYAISHIAAKYVLDELSEELVNQARMKTVEQPICAILDWKGMVKSQRETVIKILTGIGIQWYRLRKILTSTK